MEMEVSYSQIAVFDASLEEPFNDWTDDAVAAGLSASGQSVSFGMPEDGTAQVTYEIGDNPEPIDTKFGKTLSSIIEVNGGQGIEIATITESHPIDVKDGQYKVEFGVRTEGEMMVCHFAITSL